MNNIKKEKEMEQCNFSIIPEEDNINTFGLTVKVIQASNLYEATSNCYLSLIYKKK